MAADIQTILGQSPDDSQVAEFVEKLGSATATQAQVKVYSDVVYLNYFDLGISFACKPKRGYKLPAAASDLDLTQLTIDSLDVYNDPKQTGEKFSIFPIFPLSLKLVSKATEIEIRPDTDGKSLVGLLGEPTRKAGGTGSIGIWCEWTRDGILVEFAGEKARGPYAWDHGKDAVWKILTLFKG